MHPDVKVGQIVNTHGIKGEVRIISQTDFADSRFAPGQTLYLGNPHDPKSKSALKIKSHRRHKQFDLLAFEGYNNINQVLSWVGQDLYIEEDQQGDLDPDSFFIHQIIGLDVFLEDGRHLGSIKEIIQTKANDVWVVERIKQDDLLLPAIHQVIQAVDMDKKAVYIKSLEGMGLHEN